MAWTISDLFPPWGDSGERPSDNFQYDGGDQVNEKHIDYLWSSVGTLEDDVRAALEDIDADSDGVVDAADTANLLKGNDIDTNGDGVVNEADSANAYKGFDIDPDGDGEVEEYDENQIKDGGAREVDAAELGGSSGTSGNVLVSDGSATSWADVADTTTDVSDSGGTVVNQTTDINFEGQLQASDDGDGTASVSEAANFDADTVDGKHIDRAEYTTPGTYSYTIPTSADYVKVYMVGGGGGGAGDDGKTEGVGSGGGGGAVTFVEVPVRQLPGQTVDITVGSGGVGRDIDGENGSDSVFAPSAYHSFIAGGGSGGDHADSGTAANAAPGGQATSTFGYGLNGEGTQQVASGDPDSDFAGGDAINEGSGGAAALPGEYPGGGGGGSDNTDGADGADGYALIVAL